MTTFDSAEAAAFNAMTSVYVFDDPMFPSQDFARRFLADLGVNGYVVVPRHLLDELTDTASGCENCYVEARAVVEAVGPTREDQR